MSLRAGGPSPRPMKRMPGGERSQGRFRPARGGTSAGVLIATTLTYVVNSGANTLDIEIPDSPRLASSR